MKKKDKLDERQEQEISLNDLYRAKSSVNGRLARLRAYRGFRYSDYQETPITKINAFRDDIDDIEEILKGMRNRLENAIVKVYI